MATTFTYNRPDERLDAATGPADATYEASWLVDGRTSYPVRFTDDDGAWVITGTAQEVGIMAICHHLLDAALVVAISGDITDTITIPAYGANGIPFNAYEIITPVAGVDSITLTVTNNTGPAIIIGEFIAGKARTLPGTLNPHTSFRRNNFRASRPLDRAWIAPYDKGMVAEEWRGTLLLTSAQRLELLAWEESQRSGTLPSLVVINSLALCGFLEVGNQIPIGQLWKIDIVFVELPRTRW